MQLLVLISQYGIRHHVCGSSDLQSEARAEQIDKKLKAPAAGRAGGRLPMKQKSCEFELGI